MAPTEFTLKLVELVLWPLTLLFVLLLFRQPLLKLATKTRRLKYRDFEWDIETGLDKACEQASEALPDPQAALRRQLYQLSEQDANASVLEAWNVMYQASLTSLQRFGVHLPKQTSETPYKTVEGLLVEQGLCDESIQGLFTELRLIRNKVAHAQAFQVQRAEALRFIELALRLKLFFDSLQEVTA